MAESRKPLSYETHPNGVSFDVRGMRVRGALYDERRILEVSGDEETIDRLRRGLERLEAEAEARGYQRAIDALREARFGGYGDVAADYLEASAQTAIRSGESTDGV